MTADDRTAVTAQPWWENSRSWALIALLLAAPFLLVSLPPVTDALGHAARYAVQLDSGRSPDLERFYDYKWALVGNLGADLLIEPFGRLLGVERGVWLIAALIPALTGLALLALVRSVGGGRVSPLLPWAMLFVYSYPFNFGFLNYCLSLPAALAAFALWIRGIRHRAPLFVAIAAATWLCHAMGWMILALLIGAYELGRALEERPLRLKRILAGTAARVWPLATPLLLMLLLRDDLDQAQTFIVGGVESKLMRLVSALRDQDRLLDIGTLAVSGLLFLTANLLGGKRPLRLLLPVLLMLVAFLAMPTMLMGLYFADMRLAPAVMMIALTLIDCRPMTSSTRRRLAVSGLALLTIRLAISANAFVDYDRAYHHRLAALDHVPHGARILVLTRLPCIAEPWRMSRMEHLDALAVVRRHAWTNTSWDASGAQLLRVRYRPPGIFYHDPSQFVRFPPCDQRPGLRFSVKLAMLPRDGIDFVWLLDMAPAERLRRDWMIPLWSDERSALYRVMPSKGQ